MSLQVVAFWNIIALEGQNCAVVAAVTGNAEIMEWLIQRSANINLVTSSTSPLVSAIMKNRADIVRMLIDADADVNSLNHGRHTPLQVAIKRRYVSSECVINSQLLQFCNFNKQNSSQ